MSFKSYQFNTGFTILLITVIIFLTWLFKCDAIAQTNAYDFRWDPNPPDEDVAYYEIWAWDGADTTGVRANFPNNFALVGFFDHDSLLQIYQTGQLRAVDVYPSLQNGEIIIAAIQAVDGSGNGSGDFYGWAFSPDFIKSDAIPPSRPSGFGTYE